MIKDDIYLGEIKHEFYGNTEGSCAWCSRPNVNKWYIGEVSNGVEVESALYHVCDRCRKERVGE